MSTTNDILTTTEVAERLRTSTDLVCKLFHRGELQGFRAGRHLRIYAASLDEYIALRANKKRVKPEKTPMKINQSKKPPITKDCVFRHMKT